MSILKYPLSFFLRPTGEQFRCPSEYDSHGVRLLFKCKYRMTALNTLIQHRDRYRHGNITAMIQNKLTEMGEQVEFQDSAPFAPDPFDLRKGYRHDLSVVGKNGRRQMWEVHCGPLHSQVVELFENKRRQCFYDTTTIHVFALAWTVPAVEELRRLKAHLYTLGPNDNNELGLVEVEL